MEKSIPGKDKGIGEVMEVKLYFVDIFNKQIIWLDCGFYVGDR